MSILFTADIQAEFSNLDTCQKCWDEILEICSRYRIKLIVFLGDGKQAYNPVDIRIVKWWQNAIRKAVKEGITVLYLLGNHDRVGQYSDADNWLPILRRAGAITFDVPGIYQYGKQRLFMLPYTGVSKTISNAKKFLRENPKKDLDILCFHQDIKGAKYNQLGGKSDAVLDSSDLHNAEYKFCIGGHLHQPQVVKENVYYVGSPFCHDWGEVNQSKRYLIVGNTGIKSEVSTIPGWYDLSVDGFKRAKPRVWKGTKVRISVYCDASKDYGRRLEKARKKAERKYKGAEIFIVPKFQDSAPESISGIGSKVSDERKIKEYIKRTRPKASVGSLALKYMLDKLSHFEGGLRSDSRIKFIEAKGKNFLSFKNVELDFSKQGITLIQGQNKDRGNKSNGSGKTSLAQLLPVAWFGRTFKDQKSDRWANRWIPKEKAYTSVVCRGVDGRKIKIIRGRRPPLLQMFIDGKDVSSGMRSTDREGTQSQIEQITGFSWQTFSNAIYIDRSIANAFLAGTKAQRTQVLSRFQNLERFEKALRLVKDDYKELSKKTVWYERRLEGIGAELKECRKSLKDIKQVHANAITIAKKIFIKAKKKLKSWSKQSVLNKYLKKDKKLNEEYIKVNKSLSDVEGKLHGAKARVCAAQERLSKWKRFSSKEICPVCFQDLNKIIVKHHTKKLMKQLEKSVSYVVELKKIVKMLDKHLHDLAHKCTVTRTKVSELQDEKYKLQTKVYERDKNYKQVLSSTDKDIEVKKQKQINKLKFEQVHVENKFSKARKRMRMMRYAMEAFSRDGIPAFLNEQLCPILNKASSYYAELFSNSEIGLQFVVENGEFIPKIINSNGGAEIDDQSEGERALLGLIASFSLREVAPRCNVLFLDEPGDGLDEQTARQFARSLRRLVKYFKSIYVCTHNPAILSELGNEKTITVQKHHRISRII